MFDGNYENFIILLLVFARISGGILFNPLLGRRNIPSIAKVGLSIVLALCVYPLVDKTPLLIDKPLVFSIIALKEFFVGFTIGFVMQLVMSTVITAGEIADIQIGIGMSKIYDPASNISMALTGTLYNILLTLIFVGSNAHLTLIRLICESCELFPVGHGFINLEAGKHVALIFGDMLLLALKLAMPVIAAVMLTEAGLGFLMRSVPQMHIFALGLQLKLSVGFIILIASLPVISNALDTSITYMFNQISRSLEIMLTP